MAFRPILVGVLLVGVLLVLGARAWQRRRGLRAGALQRCPHCGAAVPGRLSYCPRCGEVLRSGSSRR